MKFNNISSDIFFLCINFFRILFRSEFHLHQREARAEVYRTKAAGTLINLVVHHFCTVQRFVFAPCLPASPTLLPSLHPSLPRLKNAQIFFKFLHFPPPYFFYANSEGGLVQIFFGGEGAIFTPSPPEYAPKIWQKY